MATRLLEKDIHDKQDTLVSLRRQLEDVKKLNLQLHTKLQVRACHVCLPDCLACLACLPVWCIKDGCVATLRVVLFLSHSKLTNYAN